MLHRWLRLVLGVLAVALVPARARADSSTAHTVSVAVLAFDSDDAEEQADALTGAMRSRIRASQGWSLVETSQSLGMLTAALRCPTKPIPADCEQRIADQIKSERYIFGYVAKGPQPSQVTAEIHLYQKSKPDTVIRESYADNLRDQNDDTLRKIAQRVLDRLGGTAVGVIVVRAGSESGELIVDGDKRVPTQNGTARLELSPGSHSVELAVTGQAVQKRNVLVTAGKETVVDLGSGPSTEAAKSEKPFPTRKVLGATLGGLGVVAGAVAVVAGVNYFNDKSKGESYQNGPNNPEDPKVPAGVSLSSAPFASSTCGRSGDPKFDNGTICKSDAAARRDSTIALTTGIGGAALLAAGVYFLFIADGSGEEKTGKGPHFSPTVGMSSGSLMVWGRF